MDNKNNNNSLRFGDSRDWFFDKRFGMFIHWGLYAISEWHEQELWRTDIKRSQYEKYIHEFNPTKFDPDKWIDIAEEAGMEFICITAKHCDGFCMWDTKYTDYNIMNTPYNKDILKILSDACKRRGMDFGIYYSLPDWHHPNYPNLGRHHEMEGPRETDTIDEDKYLEYVENQVRELCENYGTITQIFWDCNVAELYNPEINKMIRTLQPKIIINDRGPSEGDFTTPEREVPDGRAFNNRVMAVNSIGKESWGYRKDEDYYTTKFLMQSIDKIMAMGGSYMLNVGPKSDGTFSSEYIYALRRIGKWYKKVKEAFSDTIPYDYLSSDEVLLTKKNNSIYVHVYKDLDSSGIVLHPFTNLPKSAVLLNNKQEIKSTVDITPERFRDEPTLRLSNLPVNEIVDEPLIIKLDF